MANGKKIRKKREPVGPPTVRLRATRFLLNQARADLAEQTYWADDYFQVAEELAQENARLKKEIARLNELVAGLRKGKTDIKYLGPLH